jgi:phosphoribosylaminoimidazole-succinocarboxamide synthase
MSQDEWDEVSSMVLRLFEFGQEMALKHGLLLVDTKYEVGKDANGNLVLIDEVHTPDSSRYWLNDTYNERHAAKEVCSFLVWGTQWMFT